MEAKAAKQTQFILFGAFVALVILLGVLMGARPVSVRSDPSASTLIIGLAAAATVGAIAFALVKMRFVGAIGEPPKLPSIQAFQTDLVMALAIGELPTLLGIFMGRPLGLSPWPFVAASLVAFAVTGSRLTTYWRLRDEGL